ncbi:MAG: L-rhamnose mutarotase [Akkermansiaceae bacterium]
MIKQNISADNDFVPVAFAAVINDKACCEAAVVEITNQAEALSHMGADNIHFLSQEIGADEILLVIMDLNRFAPSTEPTEAWEFITQSPSLKAGFSLLESSIRPHQRHANSSTQLLWVPAETICKIRPNNASAVIESTSWHHAVTGLEVEKEAEYRLLHDNVWPGVIHAIGASNISRFDVFLIEFGDNQPYIFYQFLYTGIDYENDMAAQSDSPVNQRWWKFTDACQKPLPQATEVSPWLDIKAL